MKEIFTILQCSSPVSLEGMHFVNVQDKTLLTYKTKPLI